MEHLEDFTHNNPHDVPLEGQLGWLVDAEGSARDPLARACFPPVPRARASSEPPWAEFCTVAR